MLALCVLSRGLKNDMKTSTESIQDLVSQINGLAVTIQSINWTEAEVKDAKMGEHLNKDMMDAMDQANRREELHRECRIAVADALKHNKEETKQCADDGCDGSHCAKCGSHMLGWYLGCSPVCSTCEMIIDQIYERYSKLIRTLNLS